MSMPLGTDTGHRTVAGQRPFTLEAERAFIGCVMHCPARAARRLLSEIRPDDARSPIAQTVLHLAIQAVIADNAPTPVVLLHDARNHGMLTTEHRHRSFAEWLIETYQAAPFPEAGSAVKAAMLEQALRRALRERAQRLIAVVDHAEFDQLHDLATLDTEQITDLWQRHAQATQHQTAAPKPPQNAKTCGTSQLSAASARLSTPPVDDPYLDEGMDPRDAEEAA